VPVARTTQRVGQRLSAVLLLLCLPGCGRITPPQQSYTPTVTLIAPSPSPAPLAVATLVLTPAPTQTSPAPTIAAPTPTLPELAAAPATSAQPIAELTGPEAQLVAAVNGLRMQNGLPAYTLEPSLSDVARAHSCDLAAHGSISHTSSDGRTLAERLGANAALWSWPSESIAAGTADPDEVMRLRLGAKRHRALARRAARWLASPQPARPRAARDRRWLLCEPRRPQREPLVLDDDRHATGAVKRPGLRRQRCAPPSQSCGGQLAGLVLLVADLLHPRPWRYLSRWSNLWRRCDDPGRCAGCLGGGRGWRLSTRRPAARDEHPEQEQDHADAARLSRALCDAAWHDR
jgi:uncharacterized protein YkwD